MKKQSGYWPQSSKNPPHLPSSIIKLNSSKWRDPGRGGQGFWLSTRLRGIFVMALSGRNNLLGHGPAQFAVVCPRSTPALQLAVVRHADINERLRTQPELTTRHSSAAQVHIAIAVMSQLLASLAAERNKCDVTIRHGICQLPRPCDIVPADDSCLLEHKHHFLHLSQRRSAIT
jgi:hypothetical protein